MSHSQLGARTRDELPDVIADADPSDDRPSITEVNGSVAHFEMAYSPSDGQRTSFGPPFVQRIPSLIFFGAATAVAIAVFVAYHSASNSSLFRWIVEGDQHRPLGSIPFAAVIFVSALGTVLRAGMRGVVVSSEGVEARDVLPLGIPRVRKWTWAQIDRLVLDDESVLLELWDGTYERLPRVKEARRMVELLHGLALSRKRQVTRLPALAAKRR